MTDGDLRRELHREANRILIDAEYTGRQHMLAARRSRCLAVWMGLPSAIIASLASGLAAQTALLGLEARIIVPFAVAGAIFSAVRLFFKPDEQAVSHSAKGGAYLALRNEARRLMNIDLHSSLSLDAVTDRMRMLGIRSEALRSQEPMQLPEWAYAKVKAEIAAGNYDYENDSLWNDYTETRQQPEQL